MKIKDIFSKPLSVTPETLATTTRNLLYKTKKRTAFVIDGQERPVGLITLKTILSLAALRSNLQAKDIMERPVDTVEEDEQLKTAAKKMINEELKEIAVVKEGKLTGMANAIGLIAKLDGTGRKIREMGVKKTDTIDVKTELPKIIGKLKKYYTIPVTKEGKLVGIVTRTDMARRRFQSRELTAYTTAEKIMKTPVMNVDIEDDMDYAAKILIDHNVHAIPVVENMEVVGIITRLDILKERMR